MRGDLKEPALHRAADHRSAAGADHRAVGRAGGRAGRRHGGGPGGRGRHGVGRGGHGGRGPQASGAAGCRGAAHGGQYRHGLHADLSGGPDQHCVLHEPGGARPVAHQFARGLQGPGREAGRGVR
ncbi:hypothetical protein G6F22_020055 [Rhizopus arrhizus]|nr:hypothetical protein G6F22_020055 [Rhizopus arrhizus]